MKNIKYKWLLLAILLSLANLNTAWAWGGIVQGCVRYKTPSSEPTLCETDATTGTQEVYTVSSFDITGIWITNWTNNNNEDGTTISGTQMVWRLYDATNATEGAKQYRTASTTGTYDGNNRQDSWTGTITPTTNSGEYYFKYYFETWFGGKTYPSNQYLPGNESYDQIHYKLLPPNVSDFTVTPSGSIHGDGSSGNPYIVVPGNTLTLTLSGASQAHSDANSVAHYSVDGSSYGTASSNYTKTISNVRNTSNLSVTVYAKFYNSKADLNGTIKSKTIYYKADPQFNVTATYGVGGASATPASATSTGRYQGRTISATAALGYYFTGWEVVTGSATFANSTSASTTIYPTATTTVRANFSPIWYLKGDFNSWGEAHPISLVSSTSGSVELTTTTAKLSNQKFKIWNKQTGTYYQIANKAITRATPTPSGSWTSGGSGNDMKFTSDIITTYTFALTYSSNIPSGLSVTYPTAYTVTFGQGTGYGTAVTASAISAGGSFSSGDYVAAGEDITFTQSASTGYTFKGWYTAASGGTAVTGMGISDNVLDDISTNANVYAQYTPKSYTVTLNQQTSSTGYGSSGDANVTATYDAVLPEFTRPTAANGYAFMGFYTEAGGSGLHVIDDDGNLVRNVTGYTSNEETPVWKHDGAVELYAYYKKAEITALTFDAVTVAPGGTVGVTPTVSPTPVEPTKICWELRYTNDNPLASQPTMTWSAGKLTFTAPTTSGAYKIVATLKTGTDCAGGTELSTASAIFQVAGDHTVTIRYQDASGNTLKASTRVTGRPLAWSDDITAPSIFGYTFARWEAGDGVTIKNGDSDPVTTSTDATIKVKAVYDGNLTAVYNQKNIIYFKNTLGWSDVYVNLLSNSKWGYQGTGNNDNYYARNLHMTRIGDSDVWYYEYGNTSTSTYVSFTNLSQENYVGFSGGSTSTPIKVCYPTIPNPINSTTEMPYFGFYSKTPMFVPNPNYPGDDYNGNLAKYYSSGYWTKYTPGTGYYLRIYDPNNSETLIKKVEFVSEDDLIPMTVTVDLEANKTYYFEISREDQQYYSNGDNTMNYDDRYGQGVAWELYRPSTYKKTKFATTAAGDYIFHLTHGNNGSGVWRLRIAAEYPIGNQDYRLIYKDNVHTAFKPSAIITKKANSKDTVSFFVRPNNNPILYKQTATVNGSTGAITWTTTETNLITAAMKSSVITQDSVYNFNLVMNGVGALSVGDVKAYTGNYYIRTDAANNKWDNYRAADHAMTYSEYAVKNSDYSHYFMAHVNSGTNVKCVIANDYSPCISDTVIRQTYRGGDASHVGESGNIAANANVRFMWNRHDNAVYRAYLADAQSDGTKFLVLRANSSTDMMDAGGNALINSANSGQAGYNHKAPDNSIQFVDNENWIYETAVKIKPGAFVKLYAYFNSAYFYFKGTNDNTFDASHAINLMTGTGDAVLVRVVYDFKTDRLLAAWQPSGDINTEREINADVMFVREHQGDITQLTFSGSGAIKKITTAYGVLRFNKWTLNNKDKSTHAVLNPPLSRYERDLYYVSFPFRVAMNEVFGFGTYGKHWIIEYYDGAGRAEKGFWSDSPSFWKFVTDRNGKYFEPNQGYIIALDLDELGESSEVWANNVENVELYFPSYGTMPTITNSSVTHALPSHECTINRETPDGNRTIKDSHWNIMSVPTYVNTSSIAFPNTDWTATRPGYLYEWNSSDNSLTARSGTDYTYHAMHAYTVQYFGNVTWSSTSVSPSSIVARRTYAEVPKNVEFRLELSQNEQMIDQTFVKLSDDEDVSECFAFGEDMSKEFNKTRSNIYTFIGTEQVAGNTMPMSEQTTVVPVGVKIETNGDYTFSMPDGTSGIGVTLVDTETSIRTSLSALDYTIDLSAGTYDERFWLEISPISQTPTGVDDVTGDGSQVTSARKVLIDGILYIVKDDALYDARGSRVK